MVDLSGISFDGTLLFPSTPAKFPAQQGCNSRCSLDREAPTRKLQANATSEDILNRQRHLLADGVDYLGADRRLAFNQGERERSVGRRQFQNFGRQRAVLVGEVLRGGC